MRKKRGDLALSMNAIVVIILAMAMLGVGIFIVNKIRGEAADKIRIDAPPISNPATASDPFVLEYSKIRLKLGEINNEFRVSIYNNDPNPSDDETFSVKVLGDCSPSGGEIAPDTPFLTDKWVNERSEATFYTSVDATDWTDAETVSCTLGLFVNNNPARPIATEDVILEIS